MQVFGYEIGFFYARKAETPPEVRSTSLSNPANLSLFGIDTSFLNSGPATVTNETVLRVPPAWSAIRYISEGIASLDRGVFRRDSDGDVFPDHDSPVSYLFDGRPHPSYTTFDFLQTLITNACLGNGYARIHFDAQTARPKALELIPQEMVQQYYGPTGQLFYHVSGNLNNQPINVLLPETEIIHIKGVTLTGLLGKRVSLVHSGSFSTSIGAQQYSNAYFEKGASVGGLITFPNALSKEQREVLKQKLEMSHAGSKNAGSIMVLDAGADFKAMQAGPKDAAVIDFRNLTTVEVSQIFKVPLHLLSQLDRATFSNIEQQNQDFVVHCLRPWARKIEEEITTKLFTTSEIRNRRRFFAFDLSAMQMGDMEAQSKFFASAIQNGWMTPNEVRAKKNLNKIEGGDTLFIQQNMAPMDMLGEILNGKNGQTQTDTGQNSPDTTANPGQNTDNATA
jgi:HK97 family phage portal protein